MSPEGRGVGRPLPGADGSSALSSFAQTGSHFIHAPVFSSR